MKSPPHGTSGHESAEPKCFVVMPFGTKPMRDGSGRTYDFDKVYRVIIRRATQRAGMEPIRADDRVSSGIIHTDMFKDLRDRPVVLADLSLENPNVYYELGIRHVMSSTGTVLICRRGSALPFDVQLSRVVFYEYDGQSLDWEETERVVEKLQVALREARRGKPDSPVHALLGSVVREQVEPGAGVGDPATNRTPAEDLNRFQKELARFWKDAGRELPELYEEHRSTVFGVRALGCFCLGEESLPEGSERVARDLARAEQYPLANQLFKRLDEADRLDYEDLLRYASSLSEESPTLRGAERALALMHETRGAVERRFEGIDIGKDFSAMEAFARCDRWLAGLRQWKWQLTGDEGDLGAAIEAFRQALEHMARARSLGDFGDVGDLAQAHLIRMILLRIHDGSAERPDLEGHRETILALKPEPQDDAVDVSYLGWYQAIALADAGEATASLRKAVATYAEDARLMKEHLEIGRRQYTRLRRFLEQYSEALRKQPLMGRISQVLQVRRPAD